MGSESAADALGGIVVADLTSTVAGQFCARLFADHGARVTLIEPRSGNPLRAAGPRVRDRAGTARSALFWHLALGKESAFADARGVEEFISTADVIVVDDDRLLPQCATDVQVVIRITPFGAGNPLSAWSGDEIVFQALSGTMHENGAPGREPLYGVGHRASYAAGTAAFTAGLATLIAGTHGRHEVDLAIAEIAMSMNFNRVAQYSYNGSVLGRDAKETQRAVIKVKDGYLGLFVNDARWAATCAALGVADLAVDARFEAHESRRQNWALFCAVLEERLKDREIDDLVVRGQAARAVVARSMPLLALRHSEQLVDRGFWKDADRPALPRLGRMFEFSGTPQRTARVAPEVPKSALRPAVRARSGSDRLPSGEPGRPLAGIRVLDLSSAWAGPMATRMLAALGAEVLKVEGPGRIDDWRGAPLGGDADRYPGFEPGERPFDRNFQFNTQNQDKRGITLDMKSDAGRSLALRLAAQSDIVLANFATGALDRMGLGWSALREVNDRAVLIEMPAYGSTGPMAKWIAYGPSMELMSGMAGLVGYGDGRPVVTGPAYNDPIGGLNGAAAAVVALAARAVTRTGQRVEIAQRDAAMHWIGEEIIAALAAGTEPAVHGNERADAIPHRAYRAAGDDEWVVVACYDDEQFARLWRLIGGADLAALRTLGMRADARAAIDSSVAEWAATVDKHEAAERLQSAGVPAAAVMNAKDLAESSYLRSRGLIQRVAHPEAGTHEYPVLPIHIDGLSHAVGRPAPRFGEHNHDVLVGELGLTEEEYAELGDAGVIANAPRATRAADEPPVVANL